MGMMVLYLNNSCGLSLQLIPLPQLFRPHYPPDAEFQQTWRDRLYRCDRALHDFYIIILYFSTQ